MPSLPVWLTAKAAIIGGAFLALLLALGIQTARIEGFKVWPISVKGYKVRLVEKDAAIKLLQANVGTLTQALDKQNAAVEAMGAETKRQQGDAAKAVLNAQGRAQKAEGAAERLKASSRAGGAKPEGQFSKTFEDQWR